MAAYTFWKYKAILIITVTYERNDVLIPTSKHNH